MNFDEQWHQEQLAKRQERKATEWKYFFQRERTYCFDFTNLEPTERLTFEIIDEVNYLEVFKMFYNDPNPFVLADYKDLDKWESYTDLQLYMNYYSCKHGACDWLIKLKSTEQTIGLLNVHELNRETWKNFHKQCMIGYSLTADFRRQGYATEAVNRLIPYAFAQFDLNKLVANVEKGNIASQALLLKLGFVESESKFWHQKQYDYFELDRS